MSPDGTNDTTVKRQNPNSFGRTQKTCRNTGRNTVSYPKNFAFPPSALTDRSALCFNRNEIKISPYQERRRERPCEARQPAHEQGAKSCGQKRADEDLNASGCFYAGGVF
jgi:hypothetical protein